jgi:transposase InsO family protein
MRRQRLVARRIKRRNGLTRQDKTAPTFPDLLRRDFTPTAPNTRWVGDMTEIPTAAGKLYLATVIDLYSRRLLGAATGLHPDADLACQAITMAVAARGGADQIRGVILHTDRDPRPIPRTPSPSSAAGSRSASRWAAWGRASTTPLPRRSSPAWNGRPYHETTSKSLVKPKPS